MNSIFEEFENLSVEKVQWLEQSNIDNICITIFLLE